jgi:hypothetical protein
MKALGVFASALLASTLLISAPFQASAQEGAPKAEAKEKGKAKAEGKEKAKSDRYPFSGKVKSSDKVAMTITLEGKEKERVVAVTSETKISKDGKPATFGDITVGETIRGQVKKDDAGKEHAVSVLIGAAPAKKEGEKKAEKKGEKKDGEKKEEKK